MLIFKIESLDAWQAAQAEGVYEGAPVDHADGFIHFSAADQVASTLEKHFAGRDGLLLIAVNAEALGDDLRWEVSRGGALFPHLYAPLSIQAVVDVRPIPPSRDLSAFADWGVTP